MLKISWESLPALFAAIACTADLYLPIRDEVLNYSLWSEGAEVDLDTLKTVKSPKDFFLPQSETLFTAALEGREIRLEAEPFADEPFVVFGVKGCDMRGIEILDKVYLSDPVDSFYQARRGQATIVTLACEDPQATCLCKSFGIDAAEPAGDVTALMADGVLYWEARTEKGRKLTEFLGDRLEHAADDSSDAHRENIRQKIDSLPYNDGLPLEQFKPGRLKELFDSPLWDSLCRTCLSCGICTFICPTCQCYDIKDFDAGGDIMRYRCWDSCMYSDFTLMAHGNPRKTKKERFRQRFMHKLVYHPDKYDGEFSCSGCGRCVDKCPASLNIVKVIKSLGVDADV
jgi:ferredoxin